MFIFLRIRYSNALICFLVKKQAIHEVRKQLGEWRAVIQNVYECAQGRGSQNIGHLGAQNIRTKWMASKKCCRTFFVFWFGKYTIASPPARKSSLFSSIIITITLSYSIIRIQSLSSIFESPPKNRHSIFVKEILTQMFV